MGDLKRPPILLYMSFLELEAVLQGSCLVEDEVVRSCVRILEEVADTLELYCYA